MTAASPSPIAIPMAEPTIPSTSAWASTIPATCRRVAPAARSRPTSRIRSVTVIESVLKMRNAPTKSATAARSEVRAWNAPVDARRLAPRSPGPVRTYGSVVRERSRASDTAAALAPGSRPTSIRLMPICPKTTRAWVSVMTTVRPAASKSGPLPRQDPDDRDPGRRRIAQALERDRRADLQPVGGGEPFRDERGGVRRVAGARRSRSCRGAPGPPADRWPGP